MRIRRFLNVLISNVMSQWIQSIQLCLSRGLIVILQLGLSVLFLEGAGCDITTGTVGFVCYFNRDGLTMIWKLGTVFSSENAIVIVAILGCNMSFGARVFLGCFRYNAKKLHKMWQNNPYSIYNIKYNHQTNLKLS